ncbi:MAG: sensor histidine kinase [Nanobdellota archaeon]
MKSDKNKNTDYYDQSKAKAYDSQKIVIDNLPIPTLYKDFSKQTNYTNNAASNFTGFSIEELIEKDSAGLVSLIDSNVLELHRNDYVQKKGKINLSNGNKKEVLFTGRYLPKQGYIGHYQELESISGIVESENHKGKDKISLLDKKRELLLNFAHELRTPLNGIAGSLYLIENENKQTALEEYINLAKDSCERMTDISEKLIQFNYLDSHNKQNTPSYTNIESLLDQIHNRFSAPAYEKGIDFKISKTEKVPKIVYLDKENTQLILENLVSNSIKFTKGGKIELNMDYFNSGTKRVLFSVSDTGIGIPDENLDDIFCDFKQIYGTRSFYNKFYPGLGLGLAIASKATQLIGGKISVENNESTTFYVMLPLPE